MTPFWHPLSTILLTDPVCYASEVLLQTLLRVDGTAELLYAGDRMWPSVEHGDRFTVDPIDGRRLEAGSAVLACPDGIPDLLRVASIEGDSILLEADADPDVARTVSPGELLAAGRLPRRRSNPRTARRRRLLLDLREALLGAPDAHGDPAQTVLDKYESQAPLYAASDTPDLDPALGQRIREAVSPGARVLVVGSGTGRECFGLARCGFEVHGLDFAPAMIEQSEREAERLGLKVSFSLGDLRDEAFDVGSFGGILFTYDVYSFIPNAKQRIEVLSRLRSILEPHGRVFLSARRLRTNYQRAILSLAWAAHAGRGEWGNSHTRWISGDGRLHRSFVRVFSPRQLVSELDAAGMQLEGWEAGHGRLAPRLL
jgi:SAM-dependent methyltransferase